MYIITKNSCYLKTDVFKNAKQILVALIYLVVTSHV